MNPKLFLFGNKLGLGGGGGGGGMFEHLLILNHYFILKGNQFTPVK